MKQRPLILHQNHTQQNCTLMSAFFTANMSKISFRLYRVIENRHSKIYGQILERLLYQNCQVSFSSSKSGNLLYHVERKPLKDHWKTNWFQQDPRRTLKTWKFPDNKTMVIITERSSGITSSRSLKDGNQDLWNIIEATERTLKDWPNPRVNWFQLDRDAATMSDTHW